MSKISNSALDTYNLCGKKYYFQYILGYKADVTRSPLLFGTAMDNALNYILESIRDKKEWTEDKAIEQFRVIMDQWKGNNRLDYFKSELPELAKSITEYTEQEVEVEVWRNLVQRGSKLIRVYITEVLPLIDQVLHVQYRFDIPNEEGDTFSGVIDFVAKLKDGRTVLFDNKTASAKYPKNKVVTSQQLSLYSDQFPDIKYAGYIVLLKDPDKYKGVTHQILIDQIPEETIAGAFKLLDDTMKKIKNEEFPCNYKGCKAFGKPCEFERLCSYGDATGLIKRVDKKEEV